MTRKNKTNQNPPREGGNQKQKEAGRANDVANGSILNNEGNTELNEYNEYREVLLRRISKFKDMLFVESPYNALIRDLENWVYSARVISDSNNEWEVKVREILYKIGDKMLQLCKQAREEWFKVHYGELNKLFEELLRSEVRVINDKRLVLRSENLTITINRIKTRKVTIRLVLKGLLGVNIRVPKLFNGYLRRATLSGWVLSDEGRDRGRPMMFTAYTWQALLWALVHGGRIHIRIYAIDINDDGITIIWQLRAGHKRISKDSAIKWVVKFNDEEFTNFLFFFTLGDGSIDVKKQRIRLYIYKRELEQLIDKLRNYGFIEEGDGRLALYTAKAKGLAKKWYNMWGVVIDALSELKDAEKLRRIKTLAMLD